jgi:uncharacterized protein (DUF1697 family)
MEALRAIYENLGFSDVATYVQSGNVVFRAGEVAFETIAGQINRQIEKELGFEVPVLVMDVEKLQRIAEANPYAAEPEKDPAFLHLTFLANAPDKSGSSKLSEKQVAGEEYFITENAVYLYCPFGYGRTKLNNTSIESALKTSATTRNWKTMAELLRMANNLE